MRLAAGTHLLVDAVEALLGAVCDLKDVVGLALSRGLVESMGGTLTPEETPGGGLTMVIELPAAPVLLPPAFALPPAPVAPMGGVPHEQSP